jgi:predicted RNA-binding Zn-ribbon protein involved in translation (DUF1610 family)
MWFFQKLLSTILRHGRRLLFLLFAALALLLSLFAEGKIKMDSEPQQLSLGMMSSRGVFFCTADAVSVQEGMAEFLCSTPNCGKTATLACPTCIKIGIPPSRFCNQECFKSSWSLHKELHKAVKQARDEVKMDPTAVPNEFYGFNFTGPLV